MPVTDILFDPVTTPRAVRSHNGGAMYLAKFDTNGLLCSVGAAVASPAYALISALDMAGPQNYFYGYQLGSYGSLTPDTFNGSQVFALFSTDALNETPVPHCGIVLTGTLAQNFFTSITMNGVTFTSAAATFDNVSIPGYSYWEWGASPFLVTGPIGIDITP